MKESMEMLKEAERTGAIKIMIPVSELKFMLQQASKVEEMQKIIDTAVMFMQGNELFIKAEQIKLMSQATLKGVETE